MAKTRAQADSEVAFQIEGDAVGALVAALKKHGDAKVLGRELRKGLAEATDAHRDELLDAVGRMLPQRGGLGSLIKREAHWTTVARSGRWAGLWIRAVAKSSAQKKTRDLRRMLGNGRLKHPVFQSEKYPNRPDRWVIQTKGVRPEVLTDAIDDLKPEMLEAAYEVLERVARKIITEGTD